MKITWLEDFSVNNKEFDAHHKKLIDIINELHDTMMQADYKRYSEMTEKALRQMRDFARLHFPSEEKYMRQINYPDLAAHKRIHARFHIQIKKLYNDMEEGKLVLNSEILKNLTNWFQEHILLEDKKYNLFAAGKLESFQVENRT